MAKIKEKLNIAKNWIRRNAKKLAIATGVVGVVLAGEIILQPPPIPSIQVDNQTISFPNQDENSNENIIIRTNQKDYPTFLGGNNIDVYVMVENKSGKDQITNTQFYFPKTSITVNSIKVLVPNISHDIMVDDFATTTIIDATSTRIITIKTGSHKETIIGNVWQLATITEQNLEANDLWLSQGTLTEKPKPNQRADKQIQTPLLTNGITYFKVNIKIPKIQLKDEFFIQVLGDSNGAMGLLDPVILTEDFNSYGLGTLNGTSSWTGDNNWKVENTTVFEGANAIGNTNVHGDGSQQISKTGTGQANGSTTYYFYTTDTTNKAILQQNEGVTVRTQIYLGFSVGTATLSCDVNQDFGTYSANAWHRIDLEGRLNAGAALSKARLDGGAWTIWCDPTRGAWTTLDNVSVNAYNIASGGWYFDYIAGDVYVPPAAAATPNAQSIIIE